MNYTTLQKHIVLLACILFITCGWNTGISMAKDIDLSQSVLVSMDKKSTDYPIAVTVLIEEIEKRTGIRLPVSSQWPQNKTSIVVMTKTDDNPLADTQPNALQHYTEQLKPEGFFLCTYIRNDQLTFFVVGNDDRGALYGVGYLLRNMVMKQGSIILPSLPSVVSSPSYPIRGHQLGYRAKSNSYDAWDANQYDQYIRELIIFGANCIENIPFQDTDNSPHMKLSRETMNLELSAICKKYDIDYWLWIPADFDLTDAPQRAKSIEENRKFYASCPKIDAIFVPGGDPGDNHPKLLLPYMEELAAHLTASHPAAKMWISLQGFNHEQTEYFFSYVNEHNLDWLGGVVAGPSSPPIPQTRQRLPKRYGLRHYPDITHTVRCQYPVPWWDPSFMFTLGREPINPQPVFYAAVHNFFAPFTDGFLTYSDGINDDLNKTVWSQLGWNPQTKVLDILRDYTRFFFGNDIAQQAADGILALEKNWQGPLHLNGGVEATLVLWQQLESKAPHLKENWRWQMCLLRAYYDTYTRQRLQYETDLEQNVNITLARAPKIGVDQAIYEAKHILNLAETKDCNPTLHQHIEHLCDALYRSIGLQTSVEKYQGSGSERGCVLDFINHPLNNRWWLEDEFDKISKMSNEKKKLQRLHLISTWESPGPGSFYDDIGDIAQSQHVIRGEDYNTDPTMRHNPNPDTMWWDSGYSRRRLSWISYINRPLGMKYDGLDPHETYLIRLTGNGESLLKIDGERVKASIYIKNIGEFKEFPVPSHCLKDQQLILTWDAPDESHLNWRYQSTLTEVWLIKQ